MKLIALLFMSLIVAGYSSTCPIVSDYPDLVNLEAGFWKDLDGVLINAGVYQWSNEQTFNATYELVNKYMTDDINLQLPIYGVNEFGKVNVSNLVLVQHNIIGNWGERHVSNGFTWSCPTPNKYILEKTDLSIIHDIHKGIILDISQKFTEVERTSSGLKMSKLVLDVQSFLALGNLTEIFPWHAQLPYQP